MSVVCHHRHLSYAQWRLQVFQGLFCPSRRHSTLHRSSNEAFHRQPRLGQYHDFGLLRQYATRSRSKGKIGKTAQIKHRTQKQIAEEEAAAFLEETSKRVSGRPTSERVKAPAEHLEDVVSTKGGFAESPDDVDTVKENVTEPDLDTDDAAADLNHLEGRGIARLIGSTGKKALQSPESGQNSRELLQKWFSEAAENARRHEQSSRKQPQNLDKNQESKILASPSPTPRHVHEDGATAEMSSIENGLRDNEAVIPSTSQGSSPTTNGTMDSVSHGLEESSSTTATATNRRRSGQLSTFEYEQLSAMLSSLRSQLAHAEELPSTALEKANEQNLGREKEIPKTSESLPISPYQRLQGKERRMKEQAKATAKQRLQDNPWAQWLASPVRMCQATGVRLPNKLMVSWNYVRNPKDGEIYLMPEDLADMTHLGTGNKSISSPGGKTEGRLIKETSSRDELQKNGSRDPNSMSEHSSQTTSAPGEKVQGKGSESPAMPISNLPRVKPPLAPAKLYMRPSSILLLELNKTFLMKFPKEGKGSGKTRMTHAPMFSRLFPNRWKEQTRRYVDTEHHRSGFLMPFEMRDTQWHPRIHDITLNLLRLRVFKAVENVLLRNSHQIGLSSRIIGLPSRGRTEDSDEEAGATDISGIDQAVVFWLGRSKTTGSKSQDLDDNEYQSPVSHVLDQATFHNHTLQFHPHKPTVPSDASSAHKEGHKPEQAFIPLWTRDSITNETNQDANQQQQQYLPPSVNLQIHQSHENTSTNTTTSRNLPVFDLPSLLGETYIVKLHAKQAIADSLNLNSKYDRPSGWIMVKGGSGTKGFKTLVQEVWRLWLFIGGRRWEEDCMKREGRDAGEGHRVWRELPHETDAEDGR